MAAWAKEGLLIIHSSLGQHWASPKAQSVTVIIHYPTLMWAWREKTSHAPEHPPTPMFPAQSFQSSSSANPPLPISQPSHLPHPLPSSSPCFSSSSSSSYLSQSILHEITRWHRRRCPGNHCYTTVARPPCANMPRAQWGICATERIRRGYEKKEEIKGWMKGRGWKVKHWLPSPPLTLI